MGVFALSDRLAIANGTLRVDVGCKMKHSEKGATVFQAVQRYEEAPSRLSLCQPSVFLLRFFPKIPRLDRSVAARLL